MGLCQLALIAILRSRTDLSHLKGPMLGGGVGAPAASLGSGVLKQHPGEGIKVVQGTGKDECLAVKPISEYLCTGDNSSRYNY